MTIPIMFYSIPIFILFVILFVLLKRARKAKVHPFENKKIKSISILYHAKEEFYTIKINKSFFHFKINEKREVKGYDVWNTKEYLSNDMVRIRLFFNNFCLIDKITPIQFQMDINMGFW